MDIKKVLGIYNDKHLYRKKGKCAKKKHIVLNVVKPLEGGANMCKWCARESELKATREYGDNY